MSEPIWDERAEQAVIGSILLSETALSQVAGLLTADDFYRPAHGEIWDTAMELWRSGQPSDTVTVAELLERRGALTRVGSGTYLHTLIHDVPTPRNVVFYADIVSEKAMLRRIVQAGVRITQLAESGAAGSSVPDILDFVRREVAEATTGTSGWQRAVPAGTAVWEFIDNLDKEPPGLVRTPWGVLDDVLGGGVRARELVVVAALTSVGKSLVGGAMAKAAAQDGVPTVVFSLEMTREDMMARWVADVGTVELDSLVQHRLDPDEQHRAKVAAGKIEEWPLWIDDTPGLSVAQLRARCLQLPDAPGLVVIDQLSKLRPTDTRVSREQQVSRLSGECKELADHLNCPVVLLHQLNRKPTERLHGRPTKHDMRESEAVSQDAHKVLLLWRPDDSPHELRVIVDKNRQGATGEVELRVVGRHARLTWEQW